MKRKIILTIVVLIIILLISAVLHYNLVYKTSNGSYVKKFDDTKINDITLKKVEVAYDEQSCYEVTATIINNTDKIIEKQNFVLKFKYEDKKDVELVYYCEKLMPYEEKKVIVQTLKNIYS